MEVGVLLISTAILNGNVLRDRPNQQSTSHFTKYLLKSITYPSLYLRKISVRTASFSITKQKQRNLGSQAAHDQHLQKKVLSRAEKTSINCMVRQLWQFTTCRLSCGFQKGTLPNFNPCRNWMHWTLLFTTWNQTMFRRMYGTNPKAVVVRMRLAHASCCTYRKTKLCWIFWSDNCGQQKNSWWPCTYTP